MFDRFPRRSAAAALGASLAALGIGGVAFAQKSPSTSTGTAPAKVAAPAPGKEVPGQESTAPESSATDTDNVQQGDQSTPDAAGSAVETPDAAGDKPDAAGESASEVAGNDGPGGHADEPGNPNANTQQQGQH